jgi:hypothetical protein
MAAANAKKSISPLDFYTVNDFTFTNSWSIQNGSTTVLYFILTSEDSTGVRRYIPPVGTSIILNFMRQRNINQITPGSTLAQTVSKTAVVVDPRDSSLYQIQLSSAETSTIISGGVQLVLSNPTTGSTETYMIDYKVKKIMSNAGC